MLQALKDFLLLTFQKDPLLRVEAKALLKHPWIRTGNKVCFISKRRILLLFYFGLFYKFTLIYDHEIMGVEYLQIKKKKNPEQVQTNIDDVEKNLQAYNTNHDINKNKR